jgi:hypothetical protein
MKNAKSILMGTGSFVLAGLILTVFAPKAAHSLAAALVQVANTAANPALTESVDAKNALQTELSFYAPGTQTVVIPAGQRLVVDFVNIGAFAGPGTLTPFVVLQSSLNGSGSANYGFDPAPTTAPGVFVASQAVKIYADTLYVAVGVSGSVALNAIYVEISGHLVAVP